MEQIGGQLVCPAACRQKKKAKPVGFLIMHETKLEQFNHIKLLREKAVLVFVEAHLC